MNAPVPRPFRLHIADDVLRDLRERLARVRWPDEPPLDPWSTGSRLAYMKQLVAWWQGGFDWRAQEDALDRFSHFKVPPAGIDLHFIHEPGRGALPLRSEISA